MKRHGIVIIFSMALLIALNSLTFASDLIPQDWLPGDCIPQFATPLPLFGPGYNAALPRVDAGMHPRLTVTMKEAQEQVLPTFTPAAGCPPVNIQPTRVWAYETSDTKTGKILGPAHWPAVTLDVDRYTPTTVTWVNTLPSFNPLNPTGPGMVQGLISVDQTIHWADPNMMGCLMMNPPVDCVADPTNPCCSPFIGPPPGVGHMHGGETPSKFDGGPYAWFTSDGKKGPGYKTLDSPGPGKAIYFYDNNQEPGTVWVHDHALGATRTNVYSGLAVFYLIRDPSTEPKKLPEGAYEIEMALQDRQFDTNGQLFYPDGSGNTISNINGPPPNPSVHPLWIPEFIGDVAIVNGAPWPYLNVEPRRYRFRLLDGSNARFYNLSFGAAPVYVIGSDDNYINAPVRVGTVFIAPGERADVIVDFTGLAGQTITVTNDAPIPYPDGAMPGVDQPSMANIMQFQVTLPLVGKKDKSCDPAAGGCTRPKPIPRLTDTKGHFAPGVVVSKIRQLVLKEVAGAGGPLEVLVNNTSFDGLMSPSIAAIFKKDGVSELPQVGSTELWEIINLTIDAHPMHTHLAQFQILNRQAFNRDGYIAAYNEAFGTGSVPLPPGCTAGEYCAGYGPPLPYNVLNADVALGGNPALSPFLDNVNAPAVPPNAWESGWKDTAKVGPGQVMRILVRFAPTDTPIRKAKAGVNLYPFDPTVGLGYVWHCHIVDHEDNDMMRPFKVVW